LRWKTLTSSAHISLGKRSFTTRVDDDYILDKEKMKASMEEAIDFLSDGAGLK
jgi:hypothetical protein